ncbi:MAG: molybdopterin cofactor-binding domain-containing protein, partial [Pseudomonadota bacterium]
MTIQTSRRGFLKGAGAAGAALIVGLDARGAFATQSAFVANPFVRVSADGRVTVIAKHFEMGQGTTTGLATLVAEEMDAPWESVDVEWAPADDAVYGNLLFGSQGTGGSTAIANSFMQYREAGAAARALLRRAAAQAWGVDESAVTIENGAAVEAGGARTASFGELAPAAAALSLPEGFKPELKDPAAFRLIGDARLPRKDSAAKTDGSAVFAMDVTLPNMVTAVIARPPRFGGKMVSFDASETLKIKGVLAVKETPRGVAVFAESSWPAIKGRDALSVAWDFSEAENRSTDEIMAEHKAALEKPGLPARRDGDVAAALAGAAKTVEAVFEFPMLAHAPLEPLNCVIALDGDKATVWDGCQFPGLAKPALAAELGVPPENVTINTVYAGGSFGRRATPIADYQIEAAMAAKALGDGRPVRLLWTREDDIHGGYYRPLYAQKIAVGLDADGAPVAWRHDLAGKSILIGTFFEQFLVKDGVDNTSVEGANSLPYAIPNLEVSIRNTETKVPALWWRAVGHTHTAYATEVALDMAAEAAGADPVAFRRGLLAAHPRHLGVLNLAAEKAGWGAALPEGWGRGIAVHESFRSFVAMVAEVSTADGAVKVERVVVAVDCGLP